MLDIKNFAKIPLERLKNLNIGDRIELLTFKKDRKVVIIKKDINNYDVIEDGFENKEFEDIEYKNLEKLLKQLKRIEFPRSNKFFLKEILKSDLDEQVKFNLK